MYVRISAFLKWPVFCNNDIFSSNCRSMVKPVRSSLINSNSPGRTSSNSPISPVKVTGDGKKSPTKNTTYYQRISKTPPPMISPSLVTSLSSPKDKVDTTQPNCCVCQKKSFISSTTNTSTQTVDQVKYTCMKNVSFCNLYCLLIRHLNITETSLCKKL